MSRRRRRVLRILGWVSLGSVGGLIALWLAIHHVPGFGPWLADTGRRVLGVTAVARIEAFAYGVEDRVNRLFRSREAPQAYWALPSATPSASASELPDAAPDAAPPFHPKDVGASIPRIATPVDGVWVPVADLRRPDAAPLLFKTQLHPDSARPWAVLFVVAVDLSRVAVHLVAGTVDPRPTTVEGFAAKRTGLVPSEDRPRLLAAFNGGFKSEHGHYGLTTGGVTFVPPRTVSCTFASDDAGKLRIATWKAMADDAGSIAWSRGTPPCLIEDGKRHPSLWDEEATGWGAALTGETVIRRSAVGLGRERDVLYVGMGDHMTARALADGMQHAGASDVAQLDVNYSFPKFVLFRELEGGALETVGLLPDFVFEKTEYAEKASPRDFFYLTWK